MDAIYPLISRLSQELSHSRRTVVAIDGPCASGKTTLAFNLIEMFGGTVISTDDFFLQPHQRTSERLSQPGGNMDRERLETEVLIPVSKNLCPTYRKYNCHTMTFDPPVTLTDLSLVIIEGVYSLHPLLRHYYDIKVYADAAETVRRERLYTRCNGSSELLKNFTERWIPLEQFYFSHTQPQKICDIVIHT